MHNIVIFTCFLIVIEGHICRSYDDCNLIKMQILLWLQFDLIWPNLVSGAFFMQMEVLLAGGSAA